MASGYLKLICETDFNDYEVINESVNGTHQLKLKGPYIQADIKNANGRVYPKELLKPEVDKFISTMVNTGRAFGELEHPTEEFINPDRAAVRITNLKEEGNVWIGESIVLGSDPSRGVVGTPCGIILQSIIQHGGKVGFSTRGVGKINEAGDLVEEYALTTIDVVCNPSIGLFCDGIFESKNFIINSRGDIAQVAYDKLENNLKTLPVKGKNEYIEEAVRKFLRSV